MEAIAEAKNIRISPRKVRVVAKELAGKKVVEAIESLKFVPRKASLHLSKVIRSAASNATNNNKMNEKYGEDGWVDINENLVSELR